MVPRLPGGAKGGEVEAQHSQGQVPLAGVLDKEGCPPRAKGEWRGQEKPLPHNHGLTARRGTVWDLTGSSGAGGEALRAAHSAQECSMSWKGRRASCRWPAFSQTLMAALWVMVNATVGDQACRGEAAGPAVAGRPSHKR